MWFFLLSSVWKLIVAISRIKGFKTSWAFLSITNFEIAYFEDTYNVFNNYKMYNLTEQDADEEHWTLSSRGKNSVPMKFHIF